MPDVLVDALKLLAVLGVFLSVPLVVGQLEHKAMAHMQSRLGPMYAGAFHGWAQLVADGGDPDPAVVHSVSFRRPFRRRRRTGGCGGGAGSVRVSGRRRRPAAC